MIAAVRALILLALVGPVLATAVQAQDEPQVFNAFAIAVANGTIVKAAEKELMVVGTISHKIAPAIATNNRIVANSMESSSHRAHFRN